MAGTTQAQKDAARRRLGLEDEAGGAPVEEKPKRDLTDSEIINPEKEVRLVGGQRIVVRPWGMTKGHLALQRLEVALPALRDVGGMSPAVLLAKAWDEVVDLVAMTVDVSREDMERDPSEGGWTFEDVLAVTEAMLDVCILRSDGRGALPLFAALVSKMTTVVVRTMGPALAKGKENGTPHAHA